MKRKLLEPFQIGKMRLKNRIVMAPMETQYAAEDGYVTERNKDYYEARARGGAALIIVEATYIHRQGWAHANQLSISDDKFIQRADCGRDWGNTCRLCGGGSQGQEGRFRRCGNPWGSRLPRQPIFVPSFQ